jgi:hypothetical protein
LTYDAVPGPEKIGALARLRRRINDRTTRLIVEDCCGLTRAVGTHEIRNWHPH